MEIHLNNIATGLMTPAVSRYDNVLYLSWPLERLRELDPFDPAWSLPPFCGHAQVACVHCSSWDARMLASLLAVCVQYIWVWEESLCDDKSVLAGARRRRRHKEAAATFPRA